MNVSRRAFLGLLTATGTATLVNAQDNVPQKEIVPKRKFGRHDELVSVIGLGGHTLALAKSVEEARRIAHHAIEGGITLFDNAWDYHGGRAEEWMGQCLEGGWRDKVFLMSKVCTHGKPLPEGGKEGAMKMLEDSLRRLKTDRLDLWMIHELKNVQEVEKAYGPGGVIEALELAKQQGKIRYTGFTGHDSPEAHLKMLQGGYSFDATLMPVSALGALSSRSFEKIVMPELIQRRVAVIGMKGFGGSKRAHLHGLVNAEKVVRYALSYPDVCTHMIGMDEFRFVDEALAVAGKTPMTVEERDALAVACAAQGGEQYASYLQPGHRDGGCCGSLA